MTRKNCRNCNEQKSMASCPRHDGSLGGRRTSAGPHPVTVGASCERKCTGSGAWVNPSLWRHVSNVPYGSWNGLDIAGPLAIGTPAPVSPHSREDRQTSHTGE